MQVVKTVYASPSRVNFHLDSKKASIVVFLMAMFMHLDFVFDVSCLPRKWRQHLLTQKFVLP